MLKSFLEIEEYCKDNFTYFYVFLNLVIISEKPQVTFLFLLNGKGFQGLGFSFFSFSGTGPAHLGLSPPSWARARAEAVRCPLPPTVRWIQRPRHVAFPLWPR